MLEVWMQIDSDENIDIKGPHWIHQYGCLMRILQTHTCADREGGGGARGPPPPPLENYKNIGFLCNTGRDSLKNHKATKPAFHVAIIGPPAKRIKWRFAGGPLMTR